MSATWNPRQLVLDAECQVMSCWVAGALLQVDHVDLYTNQRRIFSSQLAAVVAAGTPSNGDAPSQPALRWETRNVNP